MVGLIIFFGALALGAAGLIRGIRGGQRERKQLIQAIIFIVGIFLFLVALTPKFFPNRYDSGHVSGPAVLPTDDGYRMYFTGHALSVNLGRQGTGSVGIAESTDGITWEKREGGSVLGPSLAKFSDGYAVTEPAIVQKGDTYYMYYVGKSYKGTTTIGLATSTDGVSWKKSGANPLLSAERPIPKPSDVEGWPDEQVADFLASRGYEDDFFKVNKRVWLTELLSITQRQGDPAFYPNVRIKSLAMASYVLKSGTVPAAIAISPDATIKTNDMRAIKQKIDAWFESKGIEQPDWGAVSIMSDEQIDGLLARLGLSEQAFNIPKKEYLLTVAKILDGEIGWADALRYLKVTTDAGAGATHLDFYTIYRELKMKLARGIDGDGFTDLSVVYDEAADQFRMWYVATGVKGSVLAYATSPDGTTWIRAPWGDLKDMIALNGILALSVIPDDGGYRAAVVKNGTVSLASSPDGVTGWTIDRPDVFAKGTRPAFDSLGIRSVALHKQDGKYLLWYAGEARDDDKPLPTLDELTSMKNRRLFTLGEILNCRMGWNKDVCRRFLSYAHDVVDNGSTYVDDPDTGEEAGLRTTDGAIFSYDDPLVRDIARRYNIEVEVKNAADLADVDRGDLVWSIRKLLLSRCIARYGQSLEYPKLDEIAGFDFKQVVQACRFYAVQGIPALPQPGAELTPEQQDSLGREFREQLRLFSQLCTGKRQFLDSLSTEQLVSIATNYGVVVKLGRVRNSLERNLDRINPDLLREKVEKDVKKRFRDYLKTRPIVTRIGVAASDDGLTWRKVDGPQAFDAVLDARDRFDTSRNRLQSDVENKFAGYVVLLGWMAAFLGTINLFRHHGRILARKHENWFFSLMFFFSFFFMLICSAIFYPKSVEFVRVPDPVHFAENFIANPLIATILGLLGYYITSAAYRAFRVKNIEATVMMLVAVFVMLGNIPALEFLTRNELLHTVFDQLHFPFLRDWIMNKGNAAVFRALNFGLAIGVVAMSIRIIFGIERGAFFEKL